MADVRTATDAAAGLFHEVWQDRTEVEWPNEQEPDTPFAASEGEEPWVRFSIVHGGGEQSSMGEEGGRRFENEGAVFIQIFVPAGKRGLIDADELSKVAASSLRGKSRDGVRFHRVGIRTIGRDGPWYQTNVEASYEFDEIA